MFKNYFKVAMRNLVKNKVFSAISMLGLGIGISACLLIYIVIHFELSYDNFHPDKNRIYRVVTQIKNAASKINSISSVPDPAAKVIRLSISGLESVAMFHIYETKVAIPEGDKILRRFFPNVGREEASPVILTEPQYFEI